MIVTKISDGLGNQFFQYALGRSLSHKHNKTLKLDISAFTTNYTLRDYQLKKYNIVKKEFTFFEKMYFVYFYRIVKKLIIKLNLKNKIFKNIYWEKKEMSFDEKVFKTESQYFFGYWQDLRYFKDIRDLIVKELTLKEKLNEVNLKTLRLIHETHSVSLHIRRGDYLRIKHQQVCDLEYYKKAISIIQNKVEKPVFFIFSDDIQWVKENLEIDFETHYIDFNQDNPRFDIELMKNCKHNIIANSTFSWWGAWLNEYNDKIVISPKYWSKNFPTPEGLQEKDWIFI